MWSEEEEEEEEEEKERPQPKQIFLTIKYAEITLQVCIMKYLFGFKRIHTSGQNLGKMTPTSASANKLKADLFISLN